MKHYILLYKEQAKSLKKVQTPGVPAGKNISATRILTP
jgi:hypothetical protein